MDTAPTKILVIDDDHELCKLLADYLSRYGYEVDSRTEPHSGIEAARGGGYAAIVLDTMLPGIDGIETCRRLRTFTAVPVLMLTARGDTVDRVLGLETGADDYMAKPFEPRELVARLRALMRRAAGGLAHSEAGDITLSHRSGKAYKTVAGKKVDLELTDTEFAALNLLIRHRPEAVSRDELFALMRGYERNLSDRSIDILMSRLRSKLGDKHNAPRYIRTIRMVGYAYIA